MYTFFLSWYAPKNPRQNALSVTAFSSSTSFAALVWAPFRLLDNCFIARSVPVPSSSPNHTCKQQTNRAPYSEINMLVISSSRYKHGQTIHAQSLTIWIQNKSISLCKNSQNHILHQESILQSHLCLYCTWTLTLGYIILVLPSHMHPIPDIGATVHPPYQLPATHSPTELHFWWPKTVSHPMLGVQHNAIISILD